MSIKLIIIIYLEVHVFRITRVTTSLDAIVFSLKIKSFKTFLKIFLRDFFERFLKDFFSSSLSSVWFDLFLYQVSTFYYVWNWSKSLLLWYVVVVLKATLVFIFGPNLKTKTLL